MLIFFNLNRKNISHKENDLIDDNLKKEAIEKTKRIKDLEGEIASYKYKINDLENKISINSKEFENEEKKYLKIIAKQNKTLYNIIYSENKLRKALLKRINKIYKKKGIVNINKIESKIIGGRNWEFNKNKSRVINIGVTIDPRFILKAMITLASIMDSQKNITKITFHIGVVLNFSPKDMLKIYSLRKKIRDDVEFIFYNAKRIEIDFKGLNPKGPGILAKLLLPELLPDDIERLIIFDTGDLLALRDLTEMYNWDMGDNLYLGTIDPGVGKHAIIANKTFDVYINTGHYLLDIKKIKSEKMYEKFVKYKEVYISGIGEQDLLNDIANGKIGYLPVKYGIFSPHSTDQNSETINSMHNFYFYNFIENKYNFSFIPNKTNEYYKQSFNPVVIHQWDGKWELGVGLSIYRRLAQYYIRYAKIWDEVCLLSPGYCIK